LTDPEPNGVDAEQGSRWRYMTIHTAPFAVVELAGFVLCVILGRSAWFNRDEWDFVAGRRAGDLRDLFRPHNEHWTTVPILVYRALFGVFGLRTYLPYRLVVLLLHLVAAALLFVVMRRAGVLPMIATAAAALLVFFGAGWQNILEPFQMCFTGAFVFGLAHLLLADHDGGINRRDALGLLAGLAALMTSGVGVSMVVAVGFAVLLRRGWRPALFHTVPLAACFLVWLRAIGGDSYRNDRPSLREVFRFVSIGQRATYSAMGRLPASGLVLAIVLVIGLAVALRQRRRSGELRQLAAPVALLMGSVVFLAITSTGRITFGVETARASRYLYLIAAMTLPALAVAADAIARSRRTLAPVAMALFLVGIPSNVRALVDSQDTLKPFYASTREMFLALPRDPFAAEVPRSLRPESVNARQVTIGWLLDGVAHHQIPAPRQTSTRTRASNRFRLSLDQEHAPAPTAPCRVLDGPFTTAMKKGDVLGFYDHALLIGPATGLKLVGPPLTFIPENGSAVIALRDIGPVRLDPGNTSYFPTRICGTAVGRSRG
jgi:hypothetical protein